MILASGEELLIDYDHGLLQLDLETNLKETIQKSIASETREHVCTNVKLGVSKPEANVKAITTHPVLT